MPRKITPSVRFRQPLQDALTAGGETFSYYCRQAAQAMLQTAMEAEAAEFIGRTGYQRRSEDQSVYRNGYKAHKVATGEGPVELHVPQTRNGAEPFNTRILDAYRRRRGCPDAGGCGGARREDPSGRRPRRPGSKRAPQAARSARKRAGSLTLHCTKRWGGVERIWRFGDFLGADVARSRSRAA